MSLIRISPDGQQVAIRTIFDEPAMRWNIATAPAGARNGTDDDVADWDYAEGHSPEDAE